MYTKLRLKIRHFFIKHRKTIFIILCLWVVIIFINNYLRENSFIEFERTSYDEHTSIMDGDEVPDSLLEPINEKIDTYFDYCNNKQYEEAYAMISDECKAIYFDTLDLYKEYIDTVFDEDKIYYLQNFSNYDDVYIYRMRIMEDLLATGLTGKEDLYVYEEKIAFKELEDGSISFNVRQYIDTVEFEEVYEDDYMKMWIEKKDVFYEQEIYTINVRNKTENIVVLADNQAAKEITISFGGEERAMEFYDSIVIYPDSTTEFKMQFTKFFDEDNNNITLGFNAVRILPYYSGLSIGNDFEIENAERLYSIDIPL